MEKRCFTVRDQCKRSVCNYIALNARHEECAAGIERCEKMEAYELCVSVQ